MNDSYSNNLNGTYLRYQPPSRNNTYGSKQRPSQSTPISEILCYNCKLYGHYSRECPNPKATRSTTYNAPNNSQSQPVPPQTNPGESNLVETLNEAENAINFKGFMK